MEYKYWSLGNQESVLLRLYLSLWTFYVPPVVFQKFALRIVRFACFVNSCTLNATLVIVELATEALTVNPLTPVVSTRYWVYRWVCPVGGPGALFFTYQFNLFSRMPVKCTMEIETYRYAAIGTTFPVFSKANTVLFPTVTDFELDVKPSCIQCKKAELPLPPTFPASGSTIRTMNVLPARFLSSANVGAVFAPSGFTWSVRHSWESSSRLHTWLQNCCAICC